MTYLVAMGFAIHEGGNAGEWWQARSHGSVWHARSSATARWPRRHSIVAEENPNGRELRFWAARRNSSIAHEYKRRPGAASRLVRLRFDPRVSGGWQVHDPAAPPPFRVVPLSIH
jgi:hypothetical protein